MVASNVVDLVDKPRVTYRAIDPWTLAEVDRFLDAVDGDPTGPLYAIAIGTGLRQGEILGLRWSDVDIDARSLSVTSQLDREGKRADLKTEGGRRSFGLPELAVHALRGQRAAQARQRLAAGPAWQDLDYVFTGQSVRRGTGAASTAASFAPKSAQPCAVNAFTTCGTRSPHCSSTRARRSRSSRRCWATRTTRRRSSLLTPLEGAITGRGRADRRSTQAPTGT